MPRQRIDHVAYAARDLATAAPVLETALGLQLVPGGRHIGYGTHNRLAGLGTEHYLELIAPDPDHDPASGRRWFGLEERPAPATPDAWTWIVRSDDLPALVASHPIYMGTEVTEISRGDLRWRFAVPRDRGLLAGGTLPYLIEWLGPDAGGRLPDTGFRLERITLRHPQPDVLSGWLAALALPLTPLVTVEPGPKPDVNFEILRAAATSVAQM